MGIRGGHGPILHPGSLMTGKSFFYKFRQSFPLRFDRASLSTPPHPAQGHTPRRGAPGPGAPAQNAIGTRKFRNTDRPGSV
jgi:hypothetical protein